MSKTTEPSDTFLKKSLKLINFSDNDFKKRKKLPTPRAKRGRSLQIPHILK